MRRPSAPKTLVATLAAAVCMLAAPAAFAVCGDANGDGVVSVSDGVQTLRAAAGLSSSCDENCDVDGSGAVTVSDGVNVLRKAAGLPIEENCPAERSPVASLIGHTLDLFGPLTKVGAVGAVPAGTDSPCDNPEGGFQQTESGFVFDDCVIGDVSLSGTLNVGDGSVGFSNLRVTRAGDTATLGGTLFVDDSGDAPSVSGQLNGSTPLLGSYLVTFEQVVSDTLGETQQGALVFDLVESTIQNVATIRVTLTGTNNLPVMVTFADQSNGAFTYNVNTEVLTPVDDSTPPAARVRLSNIDDRITAFLNGQQVLQASSTGPNATSDTGFVTVAGLQCGDNVFEFVVENLVPGSGYTFRAQLELGGEVVVDRSCGQAGLQGCDGNNQTQGIVARDLTFVCVPCGPCTAGAGTCAEPLQIPPSGRIQIHGTVTGANQVSGPCGGAGGPESVFRFVPGATGCYEFSTCGTSFDSQMSLGDEFCGESSGPIVEQCLDDTQPCATGPNREYQFGFFAAGVPVTILLDSEDSQGGSYVLDVRPSGACIF